MDWRWPHSQSESGDSGENDGREASTEHPMQLLYRVLSCPGYEICYPTVHLNRVRDQFLSNCEMVSVQAECKPYSQQEKVLQCICHDKTSNGTVSKKMLHWAQNNRQAQLDATQYYLRGRASFFSHTRSTNPYAGDIQRPALWRGKKHANVPDWNNYRTTEV